MPATYWRNIQCWRNNKSRHITRLFSNSNFQWILSVYMHIKNRLTLYLKFSWMYNISWCNIFTL